MRKEDVITYFGNPTKVAEALGISPAAVYQWGELIPESRAARLERITCGEEQNDIILKYDPALYDNDPSQLQKTTLPRAEQ
jgi:DNA-binding transcriptional regulator YdaS (Cro superfamily)